MAVSGIYASHFATAGEAGTILNILPGFVIGNNTIKPGYAFDKSSPA